jgi:fatty-acyl-CoA synthase
VFGIPCPRYGEQVCAWIRTAGAAGLTVEDIHAFCRDRIAGYKVPRVIRFVDAFPMTVTGKIQKFEMRTAMEREAG